MTDDIVARLRAVLHNDRSVELMNREAADEIERLRELSGDTGKLRDEIEQLRQERDGFREGNRQTLAALAEANEITKRYKSERDEARRWCCELWAGPLTPATFMTAHDYADEKGWDCFKEER